jgi:chromosome segregation ATPase
VKHGLELEVMRLQGMISTLEERMGNLSTKNDELKETVANVQAQLNIGSQKQIHLTQELEAEKVQSVALRHEKEQLRLQLEALVKTLEEVKCERDQSQKQMQGELADEKEKHTREREMARAENAKHMAELHVLQRSLKATSTDLDETQRQAALLLKEKGILTSKIDLLLDENQELNAAHAMSEEKLKRGQQRMERLEQQLGNMSIRMEVEMLLEQCVWEVVRQFESVRLKL